MQLSYERLPKVLEFVPPTFTLKTDHGSHKCHLILAAAQSGAIAQAVIDNPNISEFTISIPDLSNSFPLVIDLLHGLPIQIDIYNAFFLYTVAFELQIPELLRATRLFLPDKGSNSSILYSPLFPFRGVFYYFSPIVDETDLRINVSSTSSYGNPYEILSQELTKTFWESEDRPHPYFEIDLINKQIELKAYSIRSGNSDTDMLNPKSWIIAGSNNGYDWETLDQRDDISDLNGASFEATFECNVTNQTCRYIRFEMTEPNFKGNWVLRVSRFEVFGELISIDE